MNLNTWQLVRARLCKSCTRLAAASDKVYQLLAHGWWVSPGTPASFTTKTGRHDTTEILLKVTLKHQQSKINFFITAHPIFCTSNPVLVSGASFPVQGIESISDMDLESKYCYFYHSWNFVPY
jgi:hypothetical protein